MKFCDNRSDARDTTARNTEYSNPAANVPLVTLPMKKPESQQWKIIALERMSICCSNVMNEASEMYAVGIWVITKKVKVNVKAIKTLQMKGRIM